MEKDLEQRTKRFALAAIKLVASLPRGTASDVLGRQLLRSATSIGANYREANRAIFTRNRRSCCQSSQALEQNYKNNFSFLIPTSPFPLPPLPFTLPPF